MRKQPLGRKQTNKQTNKNFTYHGLLTLYASAVEAQCSDTVLFPLDIEDTLVVPLARLGLRKVPGQQGDGLHDTNRDVDLSGWQDLRTLLQNEKRVVFRKCYFYIKCEWRDSQNSLILWSTGFIYTHFIICEMKIIPLITLRVYSCL